MSELVHYGRFLKHRLSKCGRADLIAMVLGLRSCPFTPRLIESRTRDQLVQFLLSSACAGRAEEVEDERREQRDTHEGQWK
jgi:hypothetical protein